MVWMCSPQSQPISTRRRCGIVMTSPNAHCPMRSAYNNLSGEIEERVGARSCSNHVAILDDFHFDMDGPAVVRGYGGQNTDTGELDTKKSFTMKLIRRA